MMFNVTWISNIFNSSQINVLFLNIAFGFGVNIKIDWHAYDQNGKETNPKRERIEGVFTLKYDN